MGLYKKGRIWWFIKQCKGRKVEESLGTHIKKVAEVRYAEILTRIEDGSYFERPQEPPRMREVIQRYLRQVSPFQRGHTRNEQVASHWYDFLGDRLVSEVTTSVLSEYKARRLLGEIIYRKRKAGQSTVKKELAFLRMVLNKAIEEWEDDWGGYFRRNQINPVKKAIKGLRENRRVRYVTSEEAQKLRRWLPGWLVPMVVVACHTGLRESNIVRLSVSQCDFNSGLINIGNDEMKNGEPFTVRMTSEVKSTLQGVIKARKVLSPYVFVDDRGNPYAREAVSMAFTRAARRAGVTDLRFHDLRHDFATSLINAGATLYQVQHGLGHKDQRMTVRYAHLLPENRDVVRYLEGRGTTTILLQSDEEKGSQ